MTLDKLQGRRTKTKSWSFEAQKQAHWILQDHASELYAEAERIADRSGADAVSVTYVTQAAQAVRIGQPGDRRPEIMLAAGTALLGLGGGALFAIAITPDIHPPTASLWAATISAVAGFAIALISGTIMWTKHP
ncbi:hypothetical protein [Kribbella sp. DT2]|uniref:hypothetical protein n=1 Tax=Kribbella sp. DT2 TaxID=3393427 RepID=UPI003CFB65F7